MVSVVLAGGATAGHTPPLIATAEALKAAEPQVQITCIGTAANAATPNIIAALTEQFRTVARIAISREPRSAVIRLDA